MNKNRTALRNVVDQIRPYDWQEREVTRHVLGWIDSGVPLVREDAPSKHLVSYFVLVDNSRKSLLLVDHIKAQLWLPTGGHVMRDESPHDAVVREMAEELGPRACLVSTVAAIPLFVTAGQTRESAPHTDISLWYVVSGDVNMWLDPDPREFA